MNKEEVLKKDVKELIVSFFSDLKIVYKQRGVSFPFEGTNPFI